MSSVYKTEGIILVRRDSKEADKLISIYSRDHGKLRVRAIGAKKILSKLGGHLEPFMRTHISIATSRTVDIVTGAQVIDPYIHLRTAVQGAHAAQFLLDVVDAFTLEEEPHQEVYEQLSQGLDFLNTHVGKGAQGKVNFLVVYSILLQLLGRLGLAPNVDQCVQCGKSITPENVYYSVIQGGVVHHTCAAQLTDAQPVSANTIKALRFAMRESLSVVGSLKLPSEAWSELNTFLDQWLQAHARHPIHSRSFLAGGV